MTNIYENIPGYSYDIEESSQILAVRVWSQMLIDNPAYNKWWEVLPVNNHLLQTGGQREAYIGQ